MTWKVKTDDLTCLWSHEVFDDRKSTTSERYLAQGKAEAQKLADDLNYLERLTQAFAGRPR